MRNFTKLTDRQVALLMGALHCGRSGKAELLITEAAYRLVRAGHGPLTQEEEDLAREVHDGDFRLREAERRQRRSRRMKPRATARGVGGRAPRANLVVMNRAL
jgi:hypothetical protein